MRELVLDLSPSLINRTAVGAICDDVAATLEATPSLRLGRQYFGQRLAGAPDARRRAALLDSFRASVAAGAPPREALRWSSPDDAGAGTLFFDPLYVLYAALHPADFVMCYDLTPLTHPHWHAPEVGALYRAAYRKIIAAAPTLILSSRNTLDTLRANCGDYPGRAVVLPLYVGPRVIERALAAGPAPAARLRPYVLFVGSLEARKNLCGLIAAYALSGLAQEGIDLLIIGGRAHGAEAIEDAAARTEGVVLAGYLDDRAKLDAYAGATAFLYPSYLEGFGVPLLEAMAFGLPAVATTTGASPEVGGPLVSYVDPDDHAGLAERMVGLVRLDATQRRALKRKLQARVRAQFTLETYSRGLREVLAL